MKKFYALLISVLISVFIFIIVFDFSSLEKRESAFVSRVIDGDTIELSDRRIIRLLNVNSPEKNTEESKLSLDFLKKIENKYIEIEITGKDKYSRYLARIYAPDYINLKIVQDGLASKFLVDSSELKKFEKAENEAIKNEKGIWQHSDFFGCISTEINYEDEYIILKNSCKDINFKNWKLKDESRKVYLFNNISFNEIKLFSSKGKDTNGEIYWNSSQNIWNNDRDSLYLFDDENKIAHYNSYGY